MVQHYLKTYSAQESIVETIIDMPVKTSVKAKFKKSSPLEFYVIEDKEGFI